MVTREEAGGTLRGPSALNCRLNEVLPTRLSGMRGIVMTPHGCPIGIKKNGSNESNRSKPVKSMTVLPTEAESVKSIKGNREKQ